jgi:hypothetical protein
LIRQSEFRQSEFRLAHFPLLLTLASPHFQCYALPKLAVSLSICMPWVVPRRSDSLHAVQLERVRSWLWSLVFCVKFLPRPPPHHRPSMLTHSATTPPLFALFASFVTLSSRHPSRATLTCRLVASVGCVRCPPFPLASVLKLQALHPFLTAPFTSNLDAPSGCLGGMCSLPPFPLAGVLKLQALQGLLLFFPRDTFLGEPGCPGGSAHGFLSRLVIQSEFFSLSISMWSMRSPFSPYQTSLGSRHSRLEALGAMLLPSSSAVAL